MSDVPIRDIYTIRQVSNGYMLTIFEDEEVIVFDTEYTDALSRLATHLTYKVNQLEEKK